MESPRSPITRENQHRQMAAYYSSTVIKSYTMVISCKLKEQRIYG